MEAAEKAFSDSENTRAVEYPLDERMDSLLTALASVVVDELIALKNMGMTAADIKRLYAQELPTLAPVPTLKRRRRKEAE